MVFLVSKRRRRGRELRAATVCEFRVALDTRFEPGTQRDSAPAGERNV